MKATRIIIHAFFAITMLYQVQAQDQFIEYTGKVISQTTKQPIPTCHIYIEDADIGTVSNNSGEFAIKIANKYLQSNAVFSSIGYSSFKIPVSELKVQNTIIDLNPESLILKPVEIRIAKTIVKNAVTMIPSNYPAQEENLTAFYREIVQKNQKYIDLSQGILDINKASYSTSANSEVFIKKGYRVHQYTRDDSLAFKVQGGTNTMMLLDLVKNPGHILDPDVIDSYNYELVDLKELNGNIVYEISFEPKKLNENIKYTGLIYIDQKSMAIAKIKFGYGPEAVKTLGQDLVRKKPSFAILTPLQIDYEVSYQQSGQDWYLNYVKNTISMRCNWKKRLFNKTFTSTSELVTTVRQKGVSKSNNSKAIKYHQVFSEEIPKYYDSTFWEDYSIIKPEEDIIKALKKIEKNNSQ